ncbi:MAG TPA: TIGR03435 family protein [Vicinamibacterales bacterium]|nr:TIGR03435 family protein [Vicinamibacterales bacterium]
MRRRLAPALCASIVAIILAGIHLLGQTSQWPVYDVVSIKPAAPNATGMRVENLPGGRFSMVNGQAIMLIQMAYPGPTNEVVGAPAWVRSERYDIEARSGRNSSGDEVTLMMRAMMTDRFKLAAHYESKEIASFALVLARDDGKLGPRIRPAQVDCAALSASARTEGKVPTMPLKDDGTPACGMRSNNGVQTHSGTTMAGFARSLSSAAGRYVIDKTGLTGAYDFTLEYAPRASRDAPGGTASTSDDRPDIATALREQLGLRLEPDKTTVQIVIVDHIEKPTEN